MSTQADCYARRNEHRQTSTQEEAFFFFFTMVSVVFSVFKPFVAGAVKRSGDVDMPRAVPASGSIVPTSRSRISRSLITEVR